MAGVEIIKTGSSSTYSDCAVLSLSPEGRLLWKRRFEGEFEDRIVDLAQARDRLFLLRTHKRQDRQGTYFESAVDTFDVNGRLEWERNLSGVEALEIATGGGHVIVASVRRGSSIESTVESMSLDGSVEWTRTFENLGPAAIAFDEMSDDVIVVGRALSAVSTDKVSLGSEGRQILVTSLDADDGSIGWHHSLRLRGSFEAYSVILADSRALISGILGGELLTDKWILSGKRTAVFLVLSPNSIPENWNSFVTEDKDVALVKTSPGKDGRGFVASVLRLPPILLRPLPVSMIRRYEWISGGFRETSRRAFEGRVHDVGLTHDGEVVIAGLFRYQRAPVSIGRFQLP